MQVIKTASLVPSTILLLLCIWWTNAIENSMDGECNWSEDTSPCALLQALHKSVRALEGKMVEFVDQQYIVKILSRKVQLQNLELHRLRKTVAALKHLGVEGSNQLLPFAEPLVWVKEENPIEMTPDSVQNYENYLSLKLESLLKEAQRVQNLTESAKEDLEHIREEKISFMQEMRLYFSNSTLTLANMEERLDDLNQTILAKIVNHTSNAFNTTNIELMNLRLDDMEVKLSELRHLFSNITTSKTQNSETITCPKLESTLSSGLILEGLLDDPKPGHTVYFSCSGRRTLLGNAFTRCRTDGSWSHNNLPKCL